MVGKFEDSNLQNDSSNTVLTNIRLYSTLQIDSWLMRLVQFVTNGALVVMGWCLFEQVAKS